MSGMNDIVMVDDNPLLLCVLSEIFKEQGYMVRTASDGFAALAAMGERKPDILISDLNIPRLTGFELLPSCVASTPHRCCRYERST
jgi:CheY-like chemotaxis protein